MQLKPVPFRECAGERCYPTVVGMVMDYYTPDLALWGEELDEFCGYRDGGCWPMQHMLGMAALGYEVQWSEAFDLSAFADDPVQYMRTVFSGEALDYQLSNTDMELEQRRAQLYLDAGLPFDNKPGTLERVRELHDDGWLVSLAVNSPALFGLQGVRGHAILVTGYDDDQVVVHNPDSIYGNLAHQSYSWDLVQKAWDKNGDAYSMSAFRYPD